MKILWITSAYPWEGQPYGGVFFQTQARALADAGAEMAVLAFRPWVPHFLTGCWSRHAAALRAPQDSCDGAVRVLRFPFFGHRFHQYFGRPHRSLARQILRHLPFRPDLVHGHYAYPTGQAAVDVARILGVPSVITLHGSDVNLHAQKSALGRARFCRVVRAATSVICVSSSLATLTREISGVEPLVQPIGIDLGRFSSCLSPHEARNSLGLPNEGAIVLFVGNLEAAKGIPEALQAFSYRGMDKVTGIFIGEGSLGPQVEAHPRCFWVRPISNARIAEYMAAANLMILPSHAEGLPTVLVEAGACSLPIVATSVGGISDLLGEDRGVLVPVGNPEALATAISHCLASIDEASRKAQRLQQYVKQHFDALINGRHLVELYKSIVISRHSSKNISVTYPCE